MTDQNSLKQRAAIAAIDHLPGDGTIGIGTGSTVDFFIDALVTIENRINSVVASSERTTRRLADIGIEVQDLNHSNELAVYIDGADEIDPHGRLIKGGGGAHAREKVLAAAARKFVCIVDSSKQVKRLGRDHPLPVEVLPIARGYVARQLIAMGGQPIWREDFETDNGNWILDVHNLKIVDPAELEAELNNTPGVVDNGLFAKHTPDLVLVGSAKGVNELNF